MSRYRYLPRLAALLVLALAGEPYPSLAVASDDAAIGVSGPREKSEQPAAAALAPPAYPATRRLDLVETRFGVPVADPYRWLENDVRHDADVQAWVEAENRASFAYLRALPGRDALRARMAELYSAERFGTPRRAESGYFFTAGFGSQKQPALYLRGENEGGQRLLIDPASLSPDGSIALAEWRPSADGRYLAYALHEGGSDWRTVHVLDVATGKPLADRIEWVKYSELAWNGEGTGFYYSRFPAPAPANRFRSVVENQQIWFHAVGTPQSSDRLVHATPDRPKLGHRAQVTDDGRWLLISSSASTDTRRELTLIPLQGKDARPVRLVRGLTHEWQLAGSIGDRLYFRTTAGAPNGRLVMLDASRPREAPVEIVAEQAQPLAGASLVGSRFVVAYLSDGQAVAELVDLNGRPLGEVPLPGPGTAAGFSGRSDSPETFFSFASFTAPPTIYRYNVETGETRVFARPSLGFDPADFVTEQLSYPSRDGTMIPMTIVRRRDLAQSGRPAPTLLYGYGGFNVSQKPGFSPTRLAWIEQGGVLAIANVRGGGEFGRAWYEAGRLSNKQNVFDDFIAAAEFLKAKGYTGRDQLAIEGRSNGGLLVGAVVNQRPDLFAAALPSVGVMDMLRFDRFTAGRFWVDDYGSPDRESDFHNLRAYSPYHNIREATPYPAMLVTTADMDDRVVPGHSFKYAAALQHADLGARPRLIRIDTGAGHGSGKPTDKIVDEYADMYAFIAYWTGLTIRAK